jgi:hypothetical protein
VYELVDIIGVEVLEPHALRLTFADGTVGDVRFNTDDWSGVLEPLRDAEYFAQVRVDPESKTLAWPNGVDFAPEPLYEEARRHMVTTSASRHPTD